MIQAISVENAHFYDGAYASLFKLRKKMFVDLQKWDIPTFKDMEYDAYDNPATTYLVHLNDHNQVNGMVRIYPTDRPYMIQDVWPGIVETMTLPRSGNVYEGSRFVIDSNVDKETKSRIKRELVCSMLEFGLNNNIDYYIGVMPDNFWKSVFIGSGWNVHKLGRTITADDGSEIYAARFNVSEIHLRQVRRISNIPTPVLHAPQINNLTSKRVA